MTSLGTGTLNSSGVATFSTTSLAVGAHSLTASYGGATNFSASTSTAVSLTVTSGMTGNFYGRRLAVHSNRNRWSIGDNSSVRYT
jgi:hypothetical protein